MICAKIFLGHGVGVKKKSGEGEAKSLFVQRKFLRVLLIIHLANISFILHIRTYYNFRSSLGMAFLSHMLVGIFRRLKKGESLEHPSFYNNMRYDFCIDFLVGLFDVLEGERTEVQFVICIWVTT